MDGLSIHGDLLAIIERAQAAGVSASEAATVRLAEEGKRRMRETLETGSGAPGRPPRPRTGGLAESVTLRTTYTEVGVVARVYPRKFTGGILDRGWHAHGPVRGRGTGSFHRYPFVDQVADESLTEAEAVAEAEISVRLREANL